MTEPSIDLTLVGGPTVVIDVDGVRLITDPTFDPPGSYALGTVTLTKTSSPAMTSAQIGPVDAVLLSHDQHADNFDHAGKAFSETVPVVLTTPAAHGRLNGNSVGLSPWESHTVTGRNGVKLTIVATPARHGPPGAERKLGDVAGFVIRDASGHDLVYVTGDTVYYEGVAEVAKRYRPKVVLVFAGAARTRGPFNLTMGNNDVLEVAAAFPAARVLVAHNEGWAHFTEHAEQIEAVATAFGIEDRVASLVPGQIVRAGPTSPVTAAK